jgi:outer membrane protein with beta-barrel domain
MRAGFCVAALAVTGLLAAAPAAAQGAGGSLWGYGTTLTLNPGVASGHSEAGATLGGAIGWEVTPRFAVEGVGTWLNRPESLDAFSAAIRSRYALLPGRSTPFLEGGFGMYMTTIDAASGSVPEFYRNRLDDPARRQTFTDPAFFLGGGWNVSVSRHISLQPALEWTIVTRGAHGYALTGAAVRLAYHFEDHPVTP